MTEQYEKSRVLKGVLRVPYEMAVGPVWTRFFEGFKQKKILATKCNECGRTLVPARPFCPRCFKPMDEWMEVAQEGTIISWSYVNYTYFGMTQDMIPQVPVSVKLDGTDCGWLFGNIGGFDVNNFDLVNAKVKVGGRIKAVWRNEPEGNMLDIDHWEIIK